MKNTLRPILLLSTLVAMALTLAAWARPAERWLAPQEVLELQSNGEALIVDVRTPGEYARSHVTGALNVPLSDLEGRLVELRAAADGRPLVLYCRSGRRARVAADILRSSGLGPVWHLDGQLSGWAAAGLPVEGR